MIILGISAFYHDSSAALIVDGEILSAYQEERLTRIKQDSQFPKNSIIACLKDNKLKASEVDLVVFFEKPFLKFERILETFLAFAPKGFKSFQKAIPAWIDGKIFQKKVIRNELSELGFSEKTILNLLFSDHHLSHAASAFYPSPFKDAIVLTMDGVGEWATSSVHIGRDNSLVKIKEINFPHSLGLLYSAFTYHCGFKVNSGEYKLMGLAPYGNALYKDLIKQHLVEIKDDGSFRLNMDYFNFCTGLTMTNKKFNALFNFSFRHPEEELKQIHMDLAASIQEVLEEIVLKICRSLKEEFQIENLCLAGGVALNCVANGKIIKEKIFKEIWIQPAAGDAGGAIGAALTCYYDFLKNKRLISPHDSMKGSYLGSSFSREEVKNVLDELGANYHEELDEEKLFNKAVASLVEGQALGWFQGKMEFGPRSLGNRSILADPRKISAQKNLNLKIKFRESFRPFAPAVLADDLEDYFDLKGLSPYMLFVANVRDEIKLDISIEEKILFGIDKLNVVRSTIPAVTHVDFSARIQTVTMESNPKFYKLLETFKETTNCSVLVNTSFNIRGEPIVCTPYDAFKCFMGTDLDVLVIESFILYKSQQSGSLRADYKHLFALD